MFGYVRVERAELKVREDNYYRGTYCGLCRAMGRCTGQCSRMALNYDFVFLALVRLSLTETKTEFSQRRCLAHPMTRRSVMCQNAELDYAAASAALLNERKNADDLADEKGAKKWRARLAAPFLRHGKKKALRRFPHLRQLEEALDTSLAALSEMEASDTVSVDLPADRFGALLGDLMAFSLTGSRARIAREIGQHVGAWIYMADALDDMREDERRGRYNPFLRLWGGLPGPEAYDVIRDALKNKLYGASMALDLMEFEVDPQSVRRHLLENILYLGLPAKADEILQKQDGGKGRGKKASGRSNERGGDAQQEIENREEQNAS